MNRRQQKKMWTKYKECSCGRFINFRIGGDNYSCGTCGTVYQTKLKNRAPTFEDGTKIYIYDDGKAAREEEAVVVKSFSTDKLSHLVKKEGNDSYWLTHKQCRDFMLIKVKDGKYFIASLRVGGRAWYGLRENYAIGDTEPYDWGL